MTELFAALPRMSALIGPACSNDVVTASEWMAQNGKSATIISHYSTAPQLADEVRFPNVARFIANERVHIAGVVDLINHYKWKRISILADDTTWAAGIFAAVQTYLPQQCPDCNIINEGNSTFKLSDFRSGSLTSEDLLVQLDAVNTKIVYLVCGRREAPHTP